MSFAEYLQAGWALCDIPPGTKGPRHKGWNLAENALRDPIRAPRFNAGLCHAWSGTCAIDIDKLDTARAWLAERGVDLEPFLLAPDSVRIESGREGRAKLLYRLDTPLASVKTAPFQAISPKTGKLEDYTALDFRCATKDGVTVQDVLPPSIHPDTGQPYRWAYGDELIGDWRNLPPLPAALRAVWEAQLAPAIATPAEPALPTGTGSPELEALLASQDPNAAYNEWLRVGMALHHETGGSRDGLALWDRWSRGSAKYKGIDDLLPHWTSFRPDATNPVTLGSIRRERVAEVVDFPVVPVGTTPAPEDADPYAAMKRLLESRLVFVAGQDCYYDLGAKGDPWLSDRSVKHMFCPYMPELTFGDKMVRPDPVEFMKNSETKTVVDAVGMHPGEGRFYGEDNTRFVNRYIPRAVELLRPKLPEVEAFNFLWSRMQDATFRRWLMMFFAHAVQRPGVKIRMAPLLFSEETGTGKNTIMRDIPGLLFGPHWVRSMSGNVLGSSFNDVIGETWWLYLEELRSGATKTERVHTTNKTKTWITDRRIEVHPKGLKSHDIYNRLQVTASSNFDDAVQLDNNDRRWAVCEMGDALSERETVELFGFLNSERAPGVLRHIFSEVSLTGFNPNGRAPETRAKRGMIRAGIGQWESAIVERMVSGGAPFDKDVFYISDVIDQVLGRGGPSAVYLGRVLAKQPFLCKPLPNHNGKRMLCWRNFHLWSDFTDGQRRAHMETGARPMSREWSDEVPPQIRELSSDAVAEPLANHPCSDLL